MRKGIDVGGTFIKVIWEDGRKEKFYVKDVSGDREKFLSKVLDVVKEGDPDAVGVAVAGFTSLDGIVYRSPNIPALNRVNLKALIEKEGIRCTVGNDVSVGAFGEWYYDYRESKNLLFVAIGTGLGAGLVVDGRLYFGACGSSLELGHHTVEMDGELCSCGRRGCLEAYCSSYGFERMYEKLSGQKLKDYEVIKRAAQGCDVSQEAIRVFKRYLLVGLMNAVHILNPDLLLLGGGLIDAMKDFLGDLESELKLMVEELPSECMTLRFSKCAEFCIARGALAMVSSQGIRNYI